MQIPQISIHFSPISRTCGSNVGLLHLIMEVRIIRMGWHLKYPNKSYNNPRFNCLSKSFNNLHFNHLSKSFNNPCSNHLRKPFNHPSKLYNNRNLNHFNEFQILQYMNIKISVQKLRKLSTMKI